MKVGSAIPRSASLQKVDGMELPGGLALADGEVSKEIAWRPIDGALELDLALIFAAGRSVPEIMMQCATRAIQSIGSTSVDLKNIERLSVVDLRFVLSALSTRFGLSLQWITHNCVQCSNPFDFSVDLADLPVTGAGAGYPKSTIDIDGKPVDVFVPTGADQLATVGIEDEKTAAQTLFWRCVKRVDGVWKRKKISTKWLTKIEFAIEKMSPSMPFCVTADCPECDTANLVPINVTHWLRHLAGGPLDDVHIIASAYGWSEVNILMLSRQRRKAYVARIGRDKNGPVEELFQ